MVSETSALSLLIDSEAIERMLHMFSAKRSAYLKYDRYYNGIHDLRFATEKFSNAFGNLFRSFSDNLCPAVVDAASNRLQIIGFTSPNEDDTQPVMDIWQHNRMDRKAGDVHEEALKMGDGYVIVWPDVSGFPVIYPNSALDICVEKDEENPDTTTLAAKLWNMNDGRWRLNLYWPDRIEKYVTISKIQGVPDKAQAFIPFITLSEAWPVINPYGQVNVFHFANKSGMGTYGRSELQPVIPVQDALNKSVADMLIAMEYLSYPQRWATGLELELDVDTGRPKAPFKAAMERIWSTENPDTKFGQFESANLEQFLKVQNDFRVDMARVSDTPLHYFSIEGGGTSGFPSGEALKTAEAPFVAKILDRQITFGDTWEDVMHFCLKIINADIEGLETAWQNAAPRSELETMQVAEAKIRMGIPKQKVWKELGYTEDEITEMSALKEEEVQAATTNFMDAFARD